MKQKHPLAEYMEVHKISRESVASALHIKPSYLGHIINWHRYPSRKLAWRIIGFMTNSIGLADLLPPETPARPNGIRERI